jgi:hypothetical protein
MLNGIRKTDLITKNWSKFNKVSRPWKRRQGQATCTCTLHKPVLRGLPWEKEKVALKDRWPIKRGSIHMNFSMTGKKNVTKRRQGQATCTCTLHDQFMDQTIIVLPRMHGIRETGLIIKNWLFSRSTDLQNVKFLWLGKFLS